MCSALCFPRGGGQRRAALDCGLEPELRDTGSLRAGSGALGTLLRELGASRGWGATAAVCMKTGQRLAIFMPLKQLLGNHLHVHL